MLDPVECKLNRRILVIDDNRAIHEDFRKILSAEPESAADLEEDEAILFDAAPAPSVVFEIDSAYQGQEGLAMLQASLAENKPYAMAFVDVRMPPGWDGIETISRLWEASPDLQVVICTAYSDYSWKDIQRKLGQSDNLLILKKPFDNIEVVQLACALTRKWVVSRQARLRISDLDEAVAQRAAQLQAANEALRAEFEQRSKAEAAFRVVFEASPIGIALADATGRVLDVNPSFLTTYGLGKSELTGKQLTGIESLGYQGGTEPIINVLDTSGQAEALEVQFGQGRTGLLWLRRVALSDQPLSLAFLLDISERKAMELELQRARIDAESIARAKGQFLANMSHEIRTPLNGVLGLTALLDERDLPESVKETIRLIRTSGDILRSVVDDILDFSKIESGNFELERIPFCLKDCLDWSLGLFRAMAAEKQLEVRLQIAQNMPKRLLGDANRLRQIVANLVSNAIKFTETGGIEVRAEILPAPASHQPQRVRISVKDSGIGIPEDRLHRLFRPFSQIDATTSRRYGGTGLGLAICQGLIEMMRGSIAVHSKPGEGTTFAFDFPAETCQAENPSQEAPRQVRTCKARILVAEDNKVNQVVTQGLLRKLGYDSEIVSDGHAAVRKAGTEVFHLLLMDVQMPGISGLEATRAIRALPTGQNVPIVALTASATAEDRENCLQAGMDDYVSKPISLDALQTVLERWAARGNVPSETLQSC